MMQFRDLNAQYMHLKAKIDARIQEVIQDSNFIFGAHVVDLEQKLANYVGRKYCISCANGTDALQLVLMAWGVGAEDAVFTSDFTFIASAGCASIVGATPVFVDIDPETFNIDPDALEKAIVRVLAEGKLKPKVIIPVDLFGLPADYPRIERIAQKYGLRVLEDSAQGLGGAIDSKQACSFGDAATTSFFPSKPLGCYGDGGAIFVDDEALDAQLRSLRAQGRSPHDKYDNCIVGMNSRLDTLQAAILLEKLYAFSSFELDAVIQVAEWYTSLLQGKVKTPSMPRGYRSSWAQYTLVLEDAAQRELVKRALANDGIPSMVYYPRGLHQQNVFRMMNLSDAQFPVTTRMTRCVLSLPMHPYLRQDEVQNVSTSLLRSLS